MHNPNAVAFAGAVFMLRRALIVSLLFVPIASNDVIPVMLILNVQIFYTVYLMHVKPYESMMQNKLEITNETMALYIMYFFI